MPNRACLCGANVKKKKLSSCQKVSFSRTKIKELFITGVFLWIAIHIYKGDV